MPNFKSFCQLKPLIFSAANFEVTEKCEKRYRLIKICYHVQPYDIEIDKNLNILSPVFLMENIVMHFDKTMFSALKNGKKQKLTIIRHFSVYSPLKEELVLLWIPENNTE